MKLDVSLPALERQFSLCIRCKQCTYGSWPQNLPVCPINDKYKFFSYSGGGIIYLAKAVLLRLIEEDDYDKVLQIALKCMSCGYCGQICQLVKVGPPYQNVTDLIRMLKISLVRKGFYASEKHKEVIDKIKEAKHAGFLLPGSKSSDTLKNKAPNKGDVLVFSGCITSTRNKGTLDSVMQILNHAGIEYHMPNSEWCCGAPLLDLGDVNGVYEFAEHNLQLISNLGIRKVVYLCPHCQETFQNYSQILQKKVNFEPVFITKYLEGLIEKGILRPSKQVGYKVTYHDPCYLGRYLEDFTSSRNILKTIPGIDFIEMKRNRGESYCCGGGGWKRMLDTDNSISIGKERLRDFKETGADLLITACPMCKSQFQDLDGSAGKKAIVHDVVEIFRDSLT